MPCAVRRLTPRCGVNTGFEGRFQANKGSRAYSILPTLLWFRAKRVSKERGEFKLGIGLERKGFRRSFASSSFALVPIEKGFEGALGIPIVLRSGAKRVSKELWMHTLSIGLDRKGF